jgi:hypothetical protein
MRYYKVHFTQVNQQYIYVEARNSEDAIQKADKIVKKSLGSYNDEEPIKISRQEFEI